MGLFQAAEEWLFSVALKKMITKAVMAVSALLASATVAPVLAQLGLSFDYDKMVVGLTALGMAGLTFIQDWLRLKYGDTALGKKIL